MTKIEAVKEFIWDSNNKHLSRTSLKRVRAAGKVLGLDVAEQIEIERMLDYREHKEPFALYAKFQDKGK